MLRLPLPPLLLLLLPLVALSSLDKLASGSP
jgi:hypothetical protein